MGQRNVCSPSNGGELHNASLCDATGLMAARMSSVSHSGGLHWTAPAFVPGLPSPNDQGSLLRGDAPAGEVAPLFFSGPYSK